MRKSLLMVTFTILLPAITNGQNVSKIAKMKVADTSGHKRPFWKAFEANSPKENNGQENYKKMKLDRITYASTYLKASGIMPNNDALTLIKKLNPSLGDSVTYGTYLKLPELEKATDAQSRELFRNLKEMNRYNGKDHDDFVQQVDLFDSLYALLKKTDLNTDSVSKRKEFVITLEDLDKHLTKKVKLSKGRYQVMNKTLAIVIKVLDKCIIAKTVTQKDVSILKACHNELVSGYTAMNGNIAPNEFYEIYGRDKRSSDKKRFKIAAIPVGGPEVDDDRSSSVFADYDDVNKTCYVYALTANEAGDEIIDLQHHYYYAYLCVADALWDCYKNNCSGFTEQNQDVSFSTLNMAVAHYVFKFREKNTGKIHWRCYKQADFKIYDKKGKQLDKNEVMIIFNPGAEDCKNWL